MGSPPNFCVAPDWVYRGEGNCNAVISLPDQRKILRVRKEQRAKWLICRLLEWIAGLVLWLYYGRASYEETRDIGFYMEVMRPLLGEKYVCQAEQVSLSRKQVKDLENSLSKERPAHRKEKNLQSGRAALFQDYAFMPKESVLHPSSSDTFAVEIKPKQGWIPFSERLYPECIFCMNQYLKKEKGQTQELSRYCPLDLFSGDQGRMIRALNSLILSPQNNLQIFRNGLKCYTEGHRLSAFHDLIADLLGLDRPLAEASRVSATKEFCEMLRLVLLTDFDGSPNGCRRRMFCEWNKIIQGNALPKGSVLERILSVQMLDNEGHQYYYKLMKNRTFGDYSYVKSLLRTVKEAGEDTCLKCAIMMLGDLQSGHGPELALAPYLISAIAKDCSLMLTFQRVQVLDVSPKSTRIEGNLVHTKFGSFLVNVGVFDLYPKPVSTIAKHKDKIAKIMKLYMDHRPKKKQPFRPKT